MTTDYVYLTLKRIMDKIIVCKMWLFRILNT
ncbi:hypothetical protein ABID22_000751 [Pontibacter aydingkolensis]